ncbi:hypothetical protein ACFO8O_02460 [Hephaestia sp. GCM10023244]|uniref:hypothetical protein n=1 Tax=unclassified Hephaestia TaxID=2631281 RepID=UPI002076E81B|nr:hypothetical protein [Hephaestia sp. MAHUQ-44]MCM8729834.1 hypothetical protein [Hephaestia sp. MAHUQ-44]
MRLRLPDALPLLSGWGAVAYRVLWCAAAVLAAASMAFSYRAEVADQRNARAFYDLGLSQIGRSSAGPLVQPFSPRAKRLFNDRETLLAVDGRALPADMEGRTRTLSGPDGVPVSVGLMRADGSQHRITLTRSGSYLAEAYAGTGITWAARRWINFGLLTLGNLFWLITSLLLFLRRPRDPVAALIAMSAALGDINFYFLWSATPVFADVLRTSLANALLCIGLLAFPDGRFRPRWSRSVAILTLPAFLAGAWLGAFSVSQFSALLWPALYGAILVAVIAAILVRYRATPPGPTRQQIKIAIFGFVVGLLLLLAALVCVTMESGAANEGVRAWWILGEALVFGLGNIAMSGGLLFSLLRYRLYDADATISRSVAYGALTIALLAIFAGSERVIELMGEEYFGESLGALAGGIGAAFAAVMIVPLHHRIEHWAEKRFQKNLIHLRHDLPLLVGDLRETAGLDRIAAAVLDGVTHGVRASRAALLVGGDLIEARGIGPDEVETWRADWVPAAHDGLDCARADPVFPMRVPLAADGHGRVGWLLLGPRPDGSFYGKDERESLAEIADPVARAVQIVSVRARRERDQAERIASLERGLAAVMDRLTIRLAPTPEAAS